MKDFNLLAKIKKEVAENNVSAREFDGLTIYKYTDECNYGNKWNDINRQCRGIILDPEGNMFARPFPKFFNLGERSETSIDSVLAKGQNYEVWEKADGAMGALFNHPKHGWRLTTPGSMTSEQAEEGTCILWKKHQDILASIPDESTLVFEIISPLTRQVCDYGDTRDIILLAIIEFNGQEWHSSRVDRFANENGLKRPILYHNLDLINPYFRQGTEGYVLKWDDGFRIKVKSPEYVQVHKLLYFLNEKNIIELLQGREYRDTIKLLPKDIQLKFDDIRAQVQNKYDIIANHVGKLYSQLMSLNLSNRKDQAIWIKENATGYESLLFSLLSNKCVQNQIWKKIIEQ